MINWHKRERLYEPLAGPTPLFLPNGDQYPRSLEEVTKAVMIVDWWITKHKCDVDKLMKKLGLDASS